MHIFGGSGRSADMLVTNHVLQGALIGSVVRRPLPAFALGVVSHFVADAVPRWGGVGGGRRAFLRVAVPDGLTGLAALGLIAGASDPKRRLVMIAGMAGAALPDLDKPFALATGGLDLWPAAVNSVHRGIQRESPRRMPQEFAVAAAAAALLCLLPRLCRS